MKKLLSGLAFLTVLASGSAFADQAQVAAKVAEVEAARAENAAEVAVDASNKAEDAAVVAATAAN